MKFPLKGDQLAAFLGGQINQHEMKVVVVDHLQNLVRVADANDYARVSLALEPFQCWATNLSGAAFGRYSS